MLLTQAEITQRNQRNYLISGVVDFATVPELLRQSLSFIAAVKVSDDREMIIDLSQVTECDSAALALMLEIVKNTQQKNIEIQFENLPVTLLAIAKAYGVENEIRDLCI